MFLQLIHNCINVIFHKHNAGHLWSFGPLSERWANTALCWNQFVSQGWYMKCPAGRLQIAQLVFQFLAADKHEPQSHFTVIFTGFFFFFTYTQQIHIQMDRRPLWFSVIAIKFRTTNGTKADRSGCEMVNKRKRRCNIVHVCEFIFVKLFFY